MVYIKEIVGREEGFKSDKRYMEGEKLSSITSLNSITLTSILKEYWIPTIRIYLTKEWDPLEPVTNNDIDIVKLLETWQYILP